MWSRARAQARPRLPRGSHAPSSYQLNDSVGSCPSFCRRIRASARSRPRPHRHRLIVAARQPLRDRDRDSSRGAARGAAGREPLCRPPCAHRARQRATRIAAGGRRARRLSAAVAVGAARLRRPVVHADRDGHRSSDAHNPHRDRARSSRHGGAVGGVRRSLPHRRCLQAAHRRRAAVDRPWRLADRVPCRVWPRYRGSGRHHHRRR
jgi:hypothetical protein